MNPEFKAYLVECGADPDASDADLIKTYRGLKASQRKKADDLMLAAMTPPAPVETPKPKAKPKAAAPAAPAPVAVATDGDLHAEREARLRAEGAEQERERVAFIDDIADRFKLSAEWRGKMIAGKFGTEAIKDAALGALETVTPAVAGVGGPQVVIGADNNIETLGPAISDAVAQRAGQDCYETDDRGYVLTDDNWTEVNGVRFVSSRRARRRKPVERSRQFYGRTLADMSRLYLEALGRNTAGVSNADVAQNVFSRNYMSGVVGQFLAAGGGVHGHSTGDFPLLLSGAAFARLRAAFMETPVKWQMYCSRDTLPDFLEREIDSMGAFPDLAEVKPGGEYTGATIGEEQEKVSVLKYGRSFVINWETLINDRLGAFGRIPTIMGRAARRLEDKLATDVIINNAAMADTNALFSAAHSNLITAGGAVSVTTLDEMAANFATQTGQAGEILDIMPALLLHPAAMAGTVTQVLTSVAAPIADMSSGVVNHWAGRLMPVQLPHLDADSTAKWYVFTDPMISDTIQMSFLEGFEQPTISEDENASTIDGRRFKVRHVAGAKALEWRNVFQNDGVT